MNSWQPGSETLSRRQFLNTSLAAGCAALAAAARAAQPIVRIDKPYLKLSLAAYSFNRQMETNYPKPEGKGTMTLLEFIDFCGEMDLDGTELTSYYFPKEITHEYLNQVKEKTFRLGLDISGTAIGNNFCVPDGAPREKELAMTRQWIDYAAELGAPVIRIFAGYVPRGEEVGPALDRCITAINESVAYAAQKGVVLALENHSGLAGTPELLLDIVRRVNDSPWFGVNLDSGNFHTDDPYRDLELIAPYTVNAQIKVKVKRNGQEEAEPSDLKRVIDILKRANYRGYVVLEYEEKADPRVEVPKYLKQLRELIS